MTIDNQVLVLLQRVLHGSSREEDYGQGLQALRDALTDEQCAAVDDDGKTILHLCAYQLDALCRRKDDGEELDQHLFNVAVMLCVDLMADERFNPLQKDDAGNSPLALFAAQYYMVANPGERKFLEALVKRALLEKGDAGKSTRLVQKAEGLLDAMSLIPRSAGTADPALREKESRRPYLLFCYLRDGFLDESDELVQSALQSIRRENEACYQKIKQVTNSASVGVQTDGPRLAPIARDAAEAKKCAALEPAFVHWVDAGNLAHLKSLIDLGYRQEFKALFDRSNLMAKLFMLTSPNRMGEDVKPIILTLLHDTFQEPRLVQMRQRPVGVPAALSAADALRMVGVVRDGEGLPVVTATDGLILNQLGWQFYYIMQQAYPVPLFGFIVLQSIAASAYRDDPSVIGGMTISHYHLAIKQLVAGAYPVDGDNVQALSALKYVARYVTDLEPFYLAILRTGGEEAAVSFVAELGGHAIVKAHLARQRCYCPTTLLAILEQLSGDAEEMRASLPTREVLLFQIACQTADWSAFDAAVLAAHEWNYQERSGRSVLRFAIAANNGEGILRCLRGSVLPDVEMNHVATWFANLSVEQQLAWMQSSLLFLSAQEQCALAVFLLKSEPVAHSASYDVIKAWVIKHLSSENRIDFLVEMGDTSCWDICPDSESQYHKALFMGQLDPELKATELSCLDVMGRTPLMCALRQPSILQNAWDLFTQTKEAGALAIVDCFGENVAHYLARAYMEYPEVRNDTIFLRMWAALLRDHRDIITRNNLAEKSPLQLEDETGLSIVTEFVLAGKKWLEDTTTDRIAETYHFLTLDQLDAQVWAELLGEESLAALVITHFALHRSGGFIVSEISGVLQRFGIRNLASLCKEEFDNLWKTALESNVDVASIFELIVENIPVGDDATRFQFCKLIFRLNDMISADNDSFAWCYTWAHSDKPHRQLMTGAPLSEAMTLHDWERRDKLSRTPLHCAAIGAREDSLRSCLDCEPRPAMDVVDVFGRNVLHYLAMHLAQEFQARRSDYSLTGIFLEILTNNPEMLTQKDGFGKLPLAYLTLTQAQARALNMVLQFVQDEKIGRQNPYNIFRLNEVKVAFSRCPPEIRPAIISLLKGIGYFERAYPFKAEGGCGAYMIDYKGEPGSLVHRVKSAHEIKASEIQDHKHEVDYLGRNLLLQAARFANFKLMRTLIISGVYSPISALTDSVGRNALSYLMSHLPDPTVVRFIYEFKDLVGDAFVPMLFARDAQQQCAYDQVLNHICGSGGERVLMAMLTAASEHADPSYKDQALGSLLDVMRHTQLSAAIEKMAYALLLDSHLEVPRGGYFCDYIETMNAKLARQLQEKLSARRDPDPKIEPLRALIRILNENARRHPEKNVRQWLTDYPSGLLILNQKSSWFTTSGKTGAVEAIMAVLVNPESYNHYLILEGREAKLEHPALPGEGQQQYQPAPMAPDEAPPLFSLPPEMERPEGTPECGDGQARDATPPPGERIYPTLDRLAFWTPAGAAAGAGGEPRPYLTQVATPATVDGRRTDTEDEHAASAPPLDQFEGPPSPRGGSTSS